MESDKRTNEPSLGTSCVHAGEHRRGPAPFPTVTPIYQATTYYFERASDLEGFLKGERDGYAYSRWGTFTNSALEEAISSLVGGGSTITTASGMAANFAALQAAGLRSGKTLLASKEIYGNSYDIVRDYFERNGSRCVFTDFKDIEALEQTMEREQPEVVFFEVLANPTLSVIDAPRVIALTHAAGAKVVIDNTFATPYLYRPFLDGADYETHSLTKYINGHGDALGGSITCGQENFRDLESLVCTQGCVLSPDNAQMIARGMKTFALRMRQHCANASALASFLVGRAEITKVRYPGLGSHPTNSIAKRLFTSGEFGGMLCFDLAFGGKAKSFALIDALRLMTPAGSLGDVKSLIVHPSSTTHHGLSAEEKERIGIGESTLRVSVGIEDPRDLIRDFERALNEIL